MNQDYITVREFIREFRQTLGDTTEDIPASSIIAYLRKGLNFLAREPGLHRLFEYEDTFDLRRLKTTGDYSASWVLNGGKAQNIGYITNVSKLTVFDNTGRPYPIQAQYIPYHFFVKEYPQPELTPVGSPSAFTLRTVQGRTKLTFNAPIARPHSIDLLYSAAHPRLTKESELIRIPYLFIDALIDLVSISYYKESADFATARSQWEDTDYVVVQIRELLYRQAEGLGPRRVRRSF